MQESFALETEVFKGPLEKLLDLIEDKKMSISEVSLAQVADSYLTYIEQLGELPLAETSQFVLIASTLLLIKSRSLLPSLDLSEDERESVGDLERRLQCLRLVRIAAKSLRKVWGKNPYVLGFRAPVQAVGFAPGEAHVSKIQRAIQRVIATFPSMVRGVNATIAPVIALEEVIIRLKDRIASSLKTRWSELVKGAPKHEAIVYFLAMLELIRSGTASVTQEKLFSDITIESDAPSLPKY